MKTYVITLSKGFLKEHPRHGEPTGFEDAVKDGQKIHTIRCNFPFWEKRIKEIQNGIARLSIRQWTGKPYRSKQREIIELTAKDGIGIQRGVFSRSEWKDYDDKRHFCYWVTIEGKEADLDDVARHDGFSNIPDYAAWFDPAIDKQKPDGDGWRHLELAIIHFTRFRY